MRNRTLFPALICVLALLLTTGSLLAQIDADKFKSMKARSIGPAGMSGRVAAVASVADDPNIIYVGAATGGLWKSTNGGLNFTPVFEDLRVNSIGAVAIFQKNPSIVWIGTGEANPRNSAGVGYGVYKSMDGGETWKFLGLGATENISRILLDPDNPDVAYIGATGASWGENPERGVYKTTDGGETWEKVLYAGEQTGCADLEMAPDNPNKIFAAMWTHRRWPWFFNSGGPEGGLFVTNDGGKNWKKYTAKDGMPKGDLGRIGIAAARNNTNVVYALVEAEKSALLRSDDGGISWYTVNDKPGINPRPFYYCDIRIDPENENRVYLLHSRLQVSEDGGKDFENMYDYNYIHPDNHALWIHPEDGSRMVLGNDGGIALTTDRGKTWRFVENLPLAQFYHINIDMEFPFNVYGGLQDNGSWRGPSNLWENGGIRNYYWDEVGFGDGFAVLVDPENPQMGYCMSQGGNLQRYNNITGERKSIRPDAPDGVALRFNWNAGIAQDPFNPAAIYYGSQFVHKSTDRGDSWTIISPDLTTNDPEKQKQHESGGLTKDVTAAENFTSILTIAPSTIDRSVVWVGTDDGNVQVTRDGGQNWENVISRIDKNLPEGVWCPHIEASKFDAGTAYVVFDDHRRSNWTTYIYKTDDYGRSWKNLAKNDPTTDKENDIWGYVHVIEQDPVNSQLLYLGTEFGMYISFNDGENWLKWDHGLPSAAPVRALVVHPRDHDLVIGTHGRAAYILDDVRPFRTISENTFAEPLKLFEVPETYLHRVKQVGSMRFPGGTYFAGETKPYGAMITYSLNDETAELKEDVVIEVSDNTRKTIRTFKGSKKPGINRISWRLNIDGIESARSQNRNSDYLPGGPSVLPGSYTVTVKIGDYSESQPVEVKSDPRENFSMAARSEKFEINLRVMEHMKVINTAIKNFRKTTEALDTVMKTLKDSENSEELLEDAKALKEKISEVSEKFTPKPVRQGMSRRGTSAQEKMGRVFGMMSSTFGAASPSHMNFLRQAEKVLDDAVDAYHSLYNTEVAEFRRKLDAAGFSVFQNPDPIR